MAVPAPRPELRSSRPRRAVETCTIERWRGYRWSTFFAATAAGEALLESQSFKWRHAAPPPDDGAARAAFDGLVAGLEALGWTHAGAAGSAWYAARFTREAETTAPPVAADPPPPPEPEPVEVEPVKIALAPPAPAQPERPVPAPVAPAQPRARRRRPKRLIAALAAALAVLGGAVALAGHDTGLPAQAAPPAPARHTARPAVRHIPPAPAPAAAPARPALVHVSIAAGHAASWVEVRRGSKTGPVLYAGRLQPGRKLRLAGRRLWALFGAAGNLTITADGRPVVLSGTYEHVFRPRR